ncbi:MAG TPA: hypothetical protein VHT04_00865 [Stellaceae bacterium]|jgi:hypothetical protein|nr:hypothetical protein [Stellaceae bacterium]
MSHTSMSNTILPRSLPLAGILAALVAFSASAQPAAYEVPLPRPASEVVAADLLRGPHYQVDPEVTTFAYMNRYSVTSDFGAFAVTGDARLRRLVREIAGIAALREIETSDAFKKGAGEAAMGPVRAAKSLINEPVATISAVPEGIFSVFSRVSEQVNRGGRSQYEDGAAKSLLAVSGYKREYAQKLDFDVYSSNEILQEDLNSVAWAAASGNISVGLLSTASGSTALAAAGKVRLLDQAKNIVAAEPPQELSKRNRKTLTAMRVPEATINQFLENRVLSPRHQTVMVEAMRSLTDIPGRAAFIRYAAQAENEDSALLFQQMAELFAGYHATVSHLRQIEIYINLPVGYAVNGSAIVMVPIDRLDWTARTAEIAKKLAANVPKPLPVRTLEVWITGDASARARQELAALRIKLVERAGAQIPLLD